MKTYTSAELTSWLRDVYQTHALTVHQRLPYSSFHHHVECLGITSPDASIPRQVILRMYRGTLSWWCQETADLAAREWLGLRHAASAGVVVPKLLSARETPLGKASLLQYIAGNSLVDSNTRNGFKKFFSYSFASIDTPDNFRLSSGCFSRIRGIAIPI